MVKKSSMSTVRKFPPLHKTKCERTVIIISLNVGREKMYRITECNMKMTQKKTSEHQKYVSPGSYLL